MNQCNIFIIQLTPKELIVYAKWGENQYKSTKFFYLHLKIGSKVVRKENFSTVKSSQN